MSNDRMTLIGKELCRIKEELNGRSREEIVQAMDDACEQAMQLYESLSPATEELFIVFTLGWFMYAADIATAWHDEYRSRFAAINGLYLDVYKKRPGKHERQKAERVVFSEPDSIGTKVK